MRTASLLPSATEIVPRVVDGVELLADLFDPEGFPELAPDGAWLAVG